MEKTTLEHTHSDLKEALLHACGLLSAYIIDLSAAQSVPLLLEIGQRAGMMYTEEQICRAYGKPKA